MTDLADVRSIARPASRVVPRLHVSWIVVLYLAGAAAAGTGLATALAAEPATGEWQLTLLLRFMAVVKAAMVLGALGLTHWRLRQPIGDGLAAGFVASLALMLVAPGLIWSLHHIALGAGLFHAGLLTFLILAWRDDAAGKLLSRRRPASGPRT